MKINPRRAFMAANAAMILTCVICIYLLSVSLSRDQPPELREAEVWLAHLENGMMDPKGGEPNDLAEEIPDWEHPRDVMRPVFTLTPRPTPTPAPTATPIPLAQVINQWTPVGMDDTSVTILNQQSGEEFDMQLNGPAKTVDFSGGSRSVTVIEINLDADPPYAKFSDGTDTATKAL